MPRRGMLRLAQIYLRSYHPKFIRDAANDILGSATHMGIATSGIIPLPTQTTKLSLLRSPFVHKKSFRQFQKDDHKRLIEIYGRSTVGQDATSTVHFLRYLEHTILVAHPACSARVTLFSDETVEPASARAER